MTMTKDELKAKFEDGYRIIKAERKWRDKVFPPGHEQRDKKLGDMDKLLGILTEFKDEIKQGMEPDFEQPSLLDVPKRATYP